MEFTSFPFSIFWDGGFKLMKSHKRSFLQAIKREGIHCHKLLEILGAMIFLISIFKPEKEKEFIVIIQCKST